MSNRSANMPFRFVSCIELREVLGKRAMDEHRLLELIEEAPPDSIYYHTHSYYLRHAYTQQLYSNDFAAWIVLYAQDRVLGERLGVLDPFEFSDIEQLRDEIVRIMADHLNHSTTVVPRCIVSEPFEFLRSHIIEIPLGLEGRSLRSFMMPWPTWRLERSTTMCAKHACARNLCRLILHIGCLQKKAWGCRN